MLAIDYAEQFINSIPYVFGGSRYYADNGTDCSGLVCAALVSVHGIDPYDFGDWTGAQWRDGQFTRVIHWGWSPDLPWEDMQRGDLIFTSNCSEDFSTGNGSHVGFYTGDPDAPFLSLFGTPGAQVTAVNGVYGNECYYGVKRIICEEEQEEEMIDYEYLADLVAERVWNFEQNGTLMRDRVQGCDEAACACRVQLERTDDVTGRNTSANMYERACWIGKAVNE